MRIAIFFTAIRALCAIPAIIAFTWNGITGQTSNITRGILDDLLNHKKEIPVTSKKCMGDQLEKEYFLGAKESMITWSDLGGRVVPGFYYGKSCPEDIGSTACCQEDEKGVTWYVCNCKLIWQDPVPRWELDEVQSILNETCGEWQSGWVWSKKWEKGYNVVPKQWYKVRVKDHLQICPPGCSFW
ncbi:hypothetical protein RRF57_011038 [Xylaria bambusicola]|uniref:Uncharacterized protein n=1 Tax=Xylaria bambusicola TaxID=326684 RepID=A0AAN7UXZ2_9PEZI